MKYKNKNTVYEDQMISVSFQKKFSFAILCHSFVVQHTHLTYQSVSSLSTSCSEMLKICSVIHLLAQGFGKCVQMFQMHVKHLQQVFQPPPGTMLQPTYVYSLRKSLIFSRRPKAFCAVFLFCFGDQQSFMQK